MSVKADMARTKSSKIPNLTIFFAFYLLILSFSLPAIAQSESQTHPNNSSNSHSSSGQSSHSQKNNTSHHSNHSSSGQSHSQKNNTPHYSNHLQSHSNQSQSQSYSHFPPSAGQAQKSQPQTTNQTPSQTQSAAKSQASATLTMPMYRIRNPNGDIIIKFGSGQDQNEDDDLVFHEEEIKNEQSQQTSQASSNGTTLTPPPQATMPQASPPPPSPTTGNQGSTRLYRATLMRVFLEHHNELRAELNEAPLVWDRKLTRYARRWAAKRAAKCDIQHSNGPYGENIFMGEPGKKWTAEMAIKHWMDERAHYDAATNTCEAGEVCGHYTQMIWKGSKKLGCTLVKCANEGVFVQCNYDPPGNYEGDNPFQGAS